MKRICTWAILIIAGAILLSGCLSSDDPTSKAMSDANAAAETTPDINALLNETSQTASDNSTITELAEFILKPKTGFVSDPIIIDIQSVAFKGLDKSVSVPADQYLVMDLSESKVPSPPATYFYDADEDGIAEMPFQNGNWTVMETQRSSFQFSVCKQTGNLKTCPSKVTGIDNAGNMADYTFETVTTVK